MIPTAPVPPPSAASLKPIGTQLNVGPVDDSYPSHHRETPSSVDLYSADPHKMSYSDILDLYSRERRRDDKGERISSALASVGDGVSSIVRLWAATKGAPAIVDAPGTSLSERNRMRWDRIRRDREAKRKELEAEHRRRMLDEEASTSRRIMDEVRRRGADRDQAMLDLKIQEAIDRRDLNRANILLREAQTRGQEVKTGLAPLIARSQVARNNASARNSEASAGRNVAQGEYYRKRAKNSGTGGKKKVQVYAYGDGNSLEIDDRVVKGSIDQVYEILRSEGIVTSVDDFGAKSPSKRQSLVRERWQQSPRAVKKMLQLSEIDPDAEGDIIDGIKPKDDPKPQKKIIKGIDNIAAKKTIKGLPTQDNIRTNEQKKKIIKGI